MFANPVFITLGRYINCKIFTVRWFIYLFYLSILDSVSSRRDFSPQLFSWRHVNNVFIYSFIQSMTLLESGFHIVDLGFQVLYSSLCQWTWILDSIVRGISGSLSCIPDTKAQDSGFHRNFGIRNPLSGTSLLGQASNFGRVEPNNCVRPKTLAGQ